MYKGIYNDSINKLNESIVWTHKIQKTYLEALERRRTIISIIEITFTSLAATTATLLTIFDIKIGTIVACVVTLLSVIFASILEKVETKSNIDAFKKSSSNLWTLRCKVEELAQKAKGNVVDDEEAASEIDLLQLTFDNITSNLPTVPDKYVRKASLKIKNRKDEEVELKLL